MSASWRPILEPPKFNTYFFVVCSVAHSIRLLTGSTSPYLSSLLFVFEYGLLSCFIDTETSQEGNSWSDLIERHRGDIVAVAKWCTGSAFVEAPEDTPVLSPLVLPVAESDSDTDSDTDSESDDLDSLVSILKKK